MRETGVIIVPRRMRCVVIAAAASETQASTPHTGSQTKNPSQPASSAAWAKSAAVPRLAAWKNKTVLHGHLLHKLKIYHRYIETLSY